MHDRTARRTAGSGARGGPVRGGPAGRRPATGARGAAARPTAVALRRGRADPGRVGGTGRGRRPGAGRSAAPAAPRTAAPPGAGRRVRGAPCPAAEGRAPGPPPPRREVPPARRGPPEGAARAPVRVRHGLAVLGGPGHARPLDRRPVHGPLRRLTHSRPPPV
ncbi:hypothetical protein CG724_35025 [Streptomyces sp. CB02120-2]|nr:hypothetical protein CG724_35025 [Streptomyces sp. CB02120-2]